MLTIKAPIQLHIAQGLTGNADTFGERIRGNYGMLGARYAPKDLLFLLIAPPELPEELGGMTTLVSQQNNVDVRSVTMDVVNNVVNRIMLDGTNQFTYQDQVYITSVLNKLGITNVAQFMEQIRQLRTENESTVQLTKLYRSELERIIQRQAAGENAPALPVSGPEKGEEAAALPDPRVSMSLNILQRLETSRVYETVHNFQRNWSRSVNQFQNNEFRLAEQLRFSNSISLAQIKQQIYEQPQLNLLHHLNRYETNVMLDAPENEEAVLSQAAAAALVTAVDNTVTEVLNRPQIRQEQWLRIENAISQTAENTISRFETYHNQSRQLTQVTMPDAQQAWNYYAQELQEYRTLYQQMYPRAAEHGRVIGLPEVTQRELLHLTNVEQGDEIRQILTGAAELTQDQRQTLLQAIMLSHRGSGTQELRTAEHTRTFREERSHELERRLEREQVERTLQLSAGEASGEGEQPVAYGREIPVQTEVRPMILTDRVAEIPEGELTIEQMEQIEQFNRTLVHNAAQELQRTQSQRGAEGEVIRKTEVLREKSDVVKVDNLADSERLEAGKIPAAQLGDYIDQTRNTVIENIQQEIHRAQTQQGGTGEILHQTTVLPGEQGSMAPLHLTDREGAEEAAPLSEEQTAYIDQSSRTVMENFRQELHSTQIQQTREGDILRQTTVMPGEQGSMAPMHLTDREGSEETAPLSEEQAAYIDQSSRTVMENFRQELRRTQIQQTREGDILRQNNIYPEKTDAIKFVNLTGLESAEEGARLAEEQAASIEQSGRTVLEHFRQELQRTQSRERVERETLNETRILSEEYPDTEQGRSGPQVEEVIRRLRAEQGERAAEGMMPPVSMMGREAEVSPEFTVEQIARIEENNRILLQQLEQERQRTASQPSGGADAIRDVRPAPMEGREGEHRGAAPGGQTVSEILRQLYPEGRERSDAGVAAPVSMTGRETEVPTNLTVEQIEHMEENNRILQQYLEQDSGRSQTPPAAGIQPAGKMMGGTDIPQEQDGPVRVQGAQAVGEMLRQLRTEGQEVPRQQETVPVTLTAREAEEQAPELLAEQIERIEAHNRTLVQNLQQQTREREIHMPAAPDLRRTMRDALRALEEPEQVLREIHSRQETTIVHPEFTAEEEAALNRVDPASRGVYEQILAYQKDPEGTLARGLLKPVTMGAFQAEIRKVMQDTPLELEHQGPEAREQTELIREQSEIILEKFHRMPPQQIRQEMPRQPAAVNIVHKAVAPDVTEELLEQLQQQRTQSTVQSVTNEEITRSQSHQVDVKQIEHKVVTQTTEDITELVNRTLARQMRTISDQVYRQMEKRLQSERSRRGRF